MYVSMGRGMDGAAVLLSSRSGRRGIFRCYCDTHTTLLGLQEVPMYIDIGSLYIYHICMLTIALGMGKIGARWPI